MRERWRTAAGLVTATSPHVGSPGGVGLRGSSALLCEDHGRQTTSGQYVLKKSLFEQKND